MNALRLSAVVAALTAIFSAAAALGACSNGPSITFSVCDVPLVGEVGADGGPDPCHCDPPPELNMTTCPCLSGNATDKSLYEACMLTYQQEIADAGDAGGPIEPTTAPSCNGTCWPLFPDGWAEPQLLWFGAPSSVPPCPAVAPSVVYGGAAPGPIGGTVAIACASAAMGACPGLGDICAPGYAPGFSQCVIQPGDAGCPGFGPYTENHVFESSGEALSFCCLAAPVLP